MTLAEILVLFIAIILLPIYIYFIVLFAYIGKMTAIKYIIKLNKKGANHGEKEEEKR